MAGKQLQVEAQQELLKLPIEESSLNNLRTEIYPTVNLMPAMRKREMVYIRQYNKEVNTFSEGTRLIQPSSDTVFYWVSGSMIHDGS